MNAFLPTWGLIDRDLRKYFRSPTLMLVSLVLPLLQLVVLGHAVGGEIRGVAVALVALDHSPEALRLREKLAAIEANVRTFHVRLEETLDVALAATRDGTVAATIVIPEDYGRDVGRGERPSLGLVLDNTDPFVVSAVSERMRELIEAINQPDVPVRTASLVALDVVEMFPYVEFIQYLLPGTITLAIFVCAMIGGGLIYIDDKARGFHEGYLVTPVTKLQLVSGMLLSGALKATFAGLVTTFVGAFLAGVGSQLTWQAVLLLAALNTLVAVALISLTWLMMVRASDPLVPRALFAIVNTLLFFPSGAMYPIYSFPRWLQLLATVDPFTYSVHGFRAVLLKQVGFSAISGDLVFLVSFSLVCLTGVLLLFPRRM